MYSVTIIPMLNDNYSYLIHDTESQQTAVVDPTLAQPVLDVLAANGWQLNFIFNTHHHGDHVGGNLELKQKTGCKVVAAQADQYRIPGYDLGVNDNEVVMLGNLAAHIIATPGHTSGHIVYYFADHGLLFCGDTLFVMGCGRLFEGTAEQLWHSLQKLKRLPEATRIYCAHEYTQANGRFALSAEPDNLALQQRILAVKQARENGQPTVPSTIAQELATNPFFREDSPALQKAIGLSGKSALDVFTELRKLKDRF
ncbi:MAG: hydroxyacylglutathione hydrolase [Methylovulum sp.]|nr:hydroxyacylglutathione hydrolase [Methylovulum sp.]